MTFLTSIGEFTLTSIATTICILALVVIFINMRIKYSNTETSKSLKTFLEDEQDANFSKSNEISESYFVTANLDDLPFYKEDYLEAHFDEASRYIISNLQEKVKRYGSLKLVHAKDSVKNIDLKKQFGVRNFNLFVEYEQNRNNYTSSLREIADIYYNLKHYNVAEPFLLECKKLKSVSSKTYILLAKIYSDTKQYENLHTLKDFVETSDIFIENKISKEKILNFINSLN